jgi:hypothetical protein
MLHPPSLQLGAGAQYQVDCTSGGLHLRCANALVATDKHTCMPSLHPSVTYLASSCCTR